MTKNKSVVPEIPDEVFANVRWEAKKNRWATELFGLLSYVMFVGVGSFAALNDFIGMFVCGVVGIIGAFTMLHAHKRMIAAEMTIRSFKPQSVSINID